MRRIIWILLCVCNLLQMCAETSGYYNPFNLFSWSSQIPRDDYNYVHPYHHRKEDGMHYSETYEMRNLTLEVLQEMKVKYRQLHGVRKYHMHRIGFEIGSVIGKVREKYKRMMDHYRELLDRQRGRNQMYPPGIWWNRPFHYMIGVETLKGLEMEIDKLINVLENIPNESLNAEMNIPDEALGVEAAAADPSKVAADRVLRQGPKIEETKSDNSTLPDKTVQSGTQLPFKTEEELKKYYREKFEREHSDKDKEWTLDKFYGLA